MEIVVNEFIVPVTNCFFFFIIIELFTGPDVVQDIPQQITNEEEERNMKRKYF